MPLSLLGDLISIGIGLAFIVVALSVMWLRTTQPDLHRPFRVPFAPVTCVLGALICGGFGLYDDLVGLRARYKLFGQVLAATIAVFGFGLHWQALAALLGPAAALADPLTVLFLVAGVNAINLSDGLDGLAGGNVALGLSVVVVAAVSHGAAEVAVGWIAAGRLGGPLYSTATAVAAIRPICSSTRSFAA